MFFPEFLLQAGCASNERKIPIFNRTRDAKQCVMGPEPQQYLSQLWEIQAVHALRNLGLIKQLWLFHDQEKLFQDL